MGFIKDNRRFKKVPLLSQKKLLEKYYPNAIVKQNKESLSWVGQLKPTPLSQNYTISVQVKGNKIEVFVVNPKKLKLYKNKKQLPHVYSTSKQRLCLFFPNGKEWNRSHLISETIIPWASEWLYYYELWLITGEWLGGGTEHSVENNKKS